MARPERFELPTNWFEASYSIQLSYGRAATSWDYIDFCAARKDCFVDVAANEPKSSSLFWRYFGD